MAVDVITSRHLHRDEPPRCSGVHALDIDRQRVETLPATAVVLATGGVGKVYRCTSNPDTATGDGMATAWRAGCRVANMEFSSMQRISAPISSFRTSRRFTRAA